MILIIDMYLSFYLHDFVHTNYNPNFFALLAIYVTQPLTRFEASRPASKRVSVSSFKAGQI